MSSCCGPGVEFQAATSSRSEWARGSEALWAGPTFSILPRGKLKPMEESGFPVSLLQCISGVRYTRCLLKESVDYEEGLQS